MNLHDLADITMAEAYIIKMPQTALALQDEELKIGQNDAGDPAGAAGMPSLRQEVTFQNFRDMWSKITSKEERTALQPALVYQVCSPAIVYCQYTWFLPAPAYQIHLPGNACSSPLVSTSMRICLQPGFIVICPCSHVSRLGRSSTALACVHGMSPDECGPEITTASPSLDFPLSLWD